MILITDEGGRSADGPKRLSGGRNLPQLRSVGGMPKYAFIEFTQNFKCTTCGETGIVAPSVRYVLDGAGSLQDFESGPSDAQQARYKTTTLCHHEFLFTPNGKTIVFRTQFNSPMPGTYGNGATLVRVQNAENDFLKSLFAESQQRAIESDLAASEVFGEATTELLEAFALVRDRLKGAAQNAGLKNVAFHPEDGGSDTVEYLRDDREGQYPVIEFALTAASDDAPLALTIRGAIARTTRDVTGTAFYLFKSLTLMLSNGRRQNKVDWQPMRSMEFGETDDGWVPKIDFRSYSADPLRLKQELQRLARFLEKDDASP